MTQSLLSRLQTTVFGRRLANRESEAVQIGVLEAVPAMGLDGLGSAAYGPEAAMTVLAPLGAASLGLIGWVMAPVVALLGVLYFSYRQTIAAYPNNGGAYVVSKANLGQTASLLAAAALMIDYVLNVAVGVSAGIEALVSTLPALHPYTLVLCLAVLGLVTLANLRGAGEAGRLFALPTYLFIASFLIIIAIGVARALAGHGAPAPVTPPPPLHVGVDQAGLWLLLRSFAAGCTAMTGVEAVSNGVGAFKEPRAQRAHATLSVICATLGVLLIGVVFLARVYRIGAMDEMRPGYQSVLSQLAAAVLGRGVFYDIAMASVLAVLVLSANTSMVGFPRLCRLVAKDDFLPRAFAVAGRRLVYTAGVLYLAGAAGALLILFDGVTDRLIPLFAIGAFLTFTLSQSGMVVHWRREGSRRDLGRLALNALGATTTAAALAVIVTAKFAEGAWLTVAALPLVIVLLRSIKAYYARLERDLATSEPLEARVGEPPIVLVAVEGWNRLTQRAMIFARTLSPDITAVHLTALGGPEEQEDVHPLEARWKSCVCAPAEAAGLPSPKLEILSAAYREIHQPLVDLIGRLQRGNPGRQVAVLIPELVTNRWWESPLHMHRAKHLRELLIRDGGAGLVVIEVPWAAPRPPRPGRWRRGPGEESPLS